MTLRRSDAESIQSRVERTLCPSALPAHRTPPVAGQGALRTRRVGILRARTPALTHRPKAEPQSIRRDVSRRDHCPACVTRSNVLTALSRSSCAFADEPRSHAAIINESSARIKPCGTLPKVGAGCARADAASRCTYARTYKGVDAAVTEAFLWLRKRSYEDACRPK